MVQKRPPSAANVELSEWLGGQGYPTTPREIRTWRNYGWVDPTIVEPQGYAKPTKTSNPPEAFNQALAVAQVKCGKRMAPDLVTLALFAQGFPIRVELVRKAWLKYFTSLQVAFSKLTDPATDPFDAAEALAAGAIRVAGRSRQGRFMLKNADKPQRLSPKGSVETAKAILQSAMTVVFTGLLGGSVEELAQANFEELSALDELHHATGMSGFVDDRRGESVSIVASHEELRSDNVGIIEFFNFEALKAQSQTLSLEQLQTAREQLLILLKFMNSFSRTNGLTGGPRTAFGMSFVTTLTLDDFSIAFLSLLLAMLNKWKPRLIEDSLPMWKVESERHSALLLLIDQTPVHLRKYLSPDFAWSDLDEDTKAEIQKVTDPFREEHPELAAAITHPRIAIDPLNK